MTEWVGRKLEELSVEEKASVLAGRDMWHTVAVDRVGVPSLKVTDGPRGARGADGNHGPTSTSFPAGVAMGATWNPALIEEVGRALAHETRAKGAHVLLGPTVNIPRIPNAGRNFECFSEDPVLSGLLAVAWITGVQGGGVAACIKHFVCNDQETDRYEIDAVVTEAALREIYLEPFRIAVELAQPWALMSAYNTINGTTASEHPMLNEVLRNEFGFDGLIMSDWYGTYGPDVISSGLDLEMPGPGRWLSSESVLSALERGEISEQLLDAKVGRLLTLVERTDALSVESSGEQADERSEDRTLARRVAAESLVLLTNNGILPLDNPLRVAVIGELAVDTPQQGGGSSTVNPHRLVSILEGIRSAVGPEVEVTWSPGCQVRRGAPPLPPDSIVGGGLSVDYFDGTDLDGEPVRSVTSDRSFLSFFGTRDEWIDYDSFSLRISGRVRADAAGLHELHITASGRLRVQVGESWVIDAWSGAPTEGVSIPVDLDEGGDVDVTIEFASLPGERHQWLGLGWVTPDEDPSIEKAAEAAASADLAIVVAGLTQEWEGEGFDRPDLSLPGQQDRLISAVAAAQPNTVVVLTTGSPVEMPWLDDVSAVLQAWYAGQEVGHAVADALVGHSDPSGRLPVTFPVDAHQHPAMSTFPGEAGLVHYADNAHVGYRGFDEHGVEPLFPFGHGLSYADFEAVVTDCVGIRDGVHLQIDLTNTGARSGVEVIQVFAHGVGAVQRRLVGFEKVDLDAGASELVTIHIPPDRLRWWSPGVPGAWRRHEGDLALSVAGSFGRQMVTVTPHSA